MGLLLCAIAILLTLSGLGMAKASVTEEEFADVPEALQEEYEKADDGNYYLKIDGLENVDHPSTRPLKSALKSEREKAKAKEKEANELRERFKDLDPEEHARLKQLEAELDAKGVGKTPEEIDELVNRRTNERVKSLQEKWDEEREALTTKASDSESVADSLVVSNEMRAAGLAAGVDKSALEALQLLAERAGWKRKGKTAVLIGEDGEPRYGADGPMTAEEWVPTLREKHPYLWPRSEGPGGEDGGGGNMPPPTVDFSKMSIDEKIAFRKKYGPEEYQKQVSAASGK